MNHLLAGTAIAASLAIAAPVWAQSFTTPQSSAPSTSYSSGMPSTTTTTPYTQPNAPTTRPAGQQTQTTQPYAQQPPATMAGSMPSAGNEQATEGTTTTRHHAMRAQRTSHRVATRVSSSHRRGGQMNDNVADQLNREEAARAGSSTAPAGVMAPSPAGQSAQPVR